MITRRRQTRANGWGIDVTDDHGLYVYVAGVQTGAGHVAVARQGGMVRWYGRVYGFVCDAESAHVEFPLLRVTSALDRRLPAPVAVGELFTLARGCRASGDGTPILDYVRENPVSATLGLILNAPDFSSECRFTHENEKFYQRLLDVYQK